MCISINLSGRPLVCEFFFFFSRDFSTPIFFNLSSPHHVHKYYLSVWFLFSLLFKCTILFVYRDRAVDINDNELKWNQTWGRILQENTSLNFFFFFFCNREDWNFIRPFCIVLSKTVGFY